MQVMSLGWIMVGFTHAFSNAESRFDAIVFWRKRDIVRSLPPLSIINRNFAFIFQSGTVTLLGVLNIGYTKLICPLA